MQTATINKAIIKFWSKFHIQILWYNFTRDNRFLLTPFHSLQGKIEHPSYSISRHINNSPSVYLFLYSELNNGWKFRSRVLLKAIFSSPRTIRKQTDSAWNFLQPPIQVCRSAYISYFKITPAPIFCWAPSFWKNASILRSGSTKEMVKKHTADCHPSPSELTSRIHPLIFLWTPKGCIYPIFLEFFLKPGYPTKVVEKFQILGVKITGKYICELKSWICLFLLMSPSKILPQILIITTPGWRKLPISPQTMFFLNLFFPSSKGEGLWSWKTDQN